MLSPTTQAQLLTHMRDSHRVLHTLLARIPDERMDEIALYDSWSIKDLIAHIGWWEQTAAERVAMYRRGERPAPIETEIQNAEILARYRMMSLADVRAMEAAGVVALETQVKDAAENEIFDVNHFPATNGHALIELIAGDSYEHYDIHLPDVLVWMQKNGID